MIGNDRLTERVTIMELKQVGTARLLVELHSAYVQMCVAGGEEPSSEIHEQVEQFAVDFNDDSVSLEIRPCGRKFGIFSKSTKM